MILILRCLVGRASNPQNIARERFLFFLLSIFPDEVGLHVKSFPCLTRRKGLQDDFSKWPPNASISTNVGYYTNYCFSVAFYCDKLE